MRPTCPDHDATGIRPWASKRESGRVSIPQLYIPGQPTIVQATTRRQIGRGTQEEVKKEKPQLMDMQEYSRAQRLDSSVIIGLIYRRKLQCYSERALPVSGRPSVQLISIGAK